jgi:hypothetical protein
MPLAKCIVTETLTNNSGNVSNPVVHTYFPLSVKMKQQGHKKPDTLNVAFPMENKIDEQYNVSYIQDVVDTEWLSAVYPMQLSCLDEGGYNQDPTDPAESRFVKVDIDKFKGHYALQFTADSQGVEVPSAKTNKIDISGQFDINIWFTPDATQLQDGSDEPILWSFRNGAGLDIGISGTNGNNSSWRVFLRVDKGSIIDVYTGSSELIMNTLTNPTRIMPCHIRVKRGSDNLLKAFVNGVEDISQSVTQDLQPSGTAMVFGDTEDSTNDEYKGKIHEVKVYCGATLSDDDAKKIRITKPIVQYMKFNGSVTSIKNKQKSKVAFCNSNSYTLLLAKLGTTYGGTIQSHALSSVAFKTIAQSAVTNASPNMAFTVRTLDSFAHVQASTSLSGSIYEMGSVVEFLHILLLYSDCVMYMTPRKNIIIETDAGHNTGYTSSDLFTFDQNSITSPYNITSTASNDRQVVSQIILVGRNNSTFEFSTSALEPDGIRRTLRRSVKQLNASPDCDELSYKIARERANFGKPNTTFALAKEKYVVRSVSPIHNIRYNHKVKLKRKNGNNASVTASVDIDKDLDLDVIVSQIEWNYPSGLTVINIGEIDLDFYEDMISLTKSSDSFVDTTL